MLILGIMTLGFLVINTLVILYIGITSYNGDFDFPYLRVALIGVYFSLWNLTRMIFTIDQIYHILSFENLIFVLRMGNLFLFMSFLTIAYLLVNVSFGELTRGLGTAGMILMGGAASLVLADFIEEQAILYTTSGTEFTIHFGFLFSLLLSFGAILLSMTYILAVRSLNQLPDTIYRRNLKYEGITLIVCIVLIVSWNIFDYSNILTGFEFNIIISITMNLFYLLVFYYLARVPIYQFNMGLSAKSIVDNNYVGYFLGAVTEMGPEILQFSEKFASRTGISEIEIETLNVGATTALGMNTDIRDKIAILPLSQHQNFSSIIFTFSSKYEGIEDERIKESTMIIIGIIVPSILLVNIKNISKAQNQIISMMNSYETVNEMIDNDDLKEITIASLNYLSI